MNPEEIFDRAIGFNVEDKIDAIQSKINDLQNKIVELRFLQKKTIKELKAQHKRVACCDRTKIKLAKFFLANEKDHCLSIDEQFDFITREEKESTPLLNALEVETNKPQRKWRMPHPESDNAKVIEFIRNNPGCNRQMVRDNIKLKSENYNSVIIRATEYYSQNGLLTKHKRNGLLYFSYNG